MIWYIFVSQSKDSKQTFKKTDTKSVLRVCILKKLWKKIKPFVLRLGSLSSPDVVSSVGEISVVDPIVQDPAVVDTPLGAQGAPGNVGADTNGVGVATNAPVVDQVVADTVVVDNPAVVDPVVPDTVAVDSPVGDTAISPVVGAAVVDTTTPVEEIKQETQQTEMLSPTSNTDSLTPADPSNFYKKIYTWLIFNKFVCSLSWTKTILRT